MDKKLLPQHKSLAMGKGVKSPEEAGAAGKPATKAPPKGKGK